MLFQHLASFEQSQVELLAVQPHLKLVWRHDVVDAVVDVVLQRPPTHAPDHAAALRLSPLQRQIIK